MPLSETGPGGSPAPDALQWLTAMPERYGDRPFLIDSRTGREWTYRAFAAAARAVMADLQRRGFAKGDRLAIILPNSPTYAILYFGCLYAGIVTVPINPILPPADIAYILGHSGAKQVVVSPETVGLVPAESPLPRLRLADGRPGSDGADWHPDTLPAAPEAVPFVGMRASDTMTVVYTSGTTSRPSGVVHRIADLVDNARLFGSVHGIGPENRFYGILAMSNLPGYFNLLTLPFVHGASVAVADTFNARTVLDFWGPARRHGVNTLWLVPTILALLMELDRGDDGAAYCREQVRLVLVGTAPLPLQARLAFEARYGVRLHENYALSETLFLTSSTADQPASDGSVGHVLPGIGLEIRGEAGALPAGDEGDVAVRTPHLMAGYFDVALGDARRLDPDAWFLTGDVGLLTAAGDLFITGRKKDLIIRGGINISPGSIEHVLHEHPAVAECAVIGVPHAIYGEDVAAVVRLKPGSDFTVVKPELQALCQERLGPVRRPAHLLALESLPRSSAGKIRKADLRQMAAATLGLTDIPLFNRPPSP